MHPDSKIRLAVLLPALAEDLLSVVHDPACLPLHQSDPGCIIVGEQSEDDDEVFGDDVHVLSVCA